MIDMGFLLYFIKIVCHRFHFAVHVVDIEKNVKQLSKCRLNLENIDNFFQLFIEVVFQKNCGQNTVKHL